VAVNEPRSGWWFWGDKFDLLLLTFLILVMVPIIIVTKADWASDTLKLTLGALLGAIQHRSRSGRKGDP
jgi:hypothetical protein